MIDCFNRYQSNCDGASILICDMIIVNDQVHSLWDVRDSTETTIVPNQLFCVLDSFGTRETGFTSVFVSNVFS
jgi:hypothetical protein